MTRFFADKTNITDGLIKLTSEDAAHIRTLRLRPSELFIVCDGEGTDYIVKQGDRHLSPCFTAEIVETRPSLGEPTIHCSVYVAFMKGDRLDYAVQKSVELGAARIILYPSERCVSIPGDIAKKTTRLQRIALETAKQSGRGRIPEVSSTETFKSAVAEASKADLPLFFYEDENETSLKTILLKQGDRCCASHEAQHLSPCFAIMTGPEGGFAHHEAEHALSEGMHIISLGPRILRCETAPAAALAAIMYHTGNL